MIPKELSTGNGTIKVPYKYALGIRTFYVDRSQPDSVKLPYRITENNETRLHHDVQILLFPRATAMPLVAKSRWPIYSP